MRKADVIIRHIDGQPTPSVNVKVHCWDYLQHVPEIADELGIPGFTAENGEQQTVQEVLCDVINSSGRCEVWATPENLGYFSELFVSECMRDREVEG